MAPNPIATFVALRSHLLLLLITTAAVATVFAVAADPIVLPRPLAILFNLVPPLLAHLVVRRSSKIADQRGILLVGFGVAAALQIAFLTVAVDQALLLRGIDLFGSRQESLYGLVALVAPMWVGTALIATLMLAAFVSLTAAGRHSPR